MESRSADIIGNDVKFPSMVLNIAVAGNLSKSEYERNAILTKLQRVINDAAGYSRKYAKAEYGFSSKEPVIHFLSSPLLADAGLIAELKDGICPGAAISCVSDDHEDKGFASCGASVSYINKADDSHSSDSSVIFSWLCDQADFSIIISDDQNPLILGFRKHCKNTAIPAVVISPDTGRHMLWTQKSAYDSYDDDKLKMHLDSLFFDMIPDGGENRALERKLPLANMYARFLKKFKAASVKDKPAPKDTIMDESGDAGFLSDRASSTRTRLIKWFKKYDDLGMRYSEKYRASIYLRAVIPLVVTAALAVGFYIEALMSPWQVSIPGTRLQLWSIIAGLGFFTHALLNLYVFKLSEDRDVGLWHKSFIDNRFMAEALRMAIHFMPFGIPVNYSQVLHRYGEKGKSKMKMIHRLKCIQKEAGLPQTVFKGRIPEECLLSLEEFVDDQIEYHKSKANMYARIYKRLKSFGTAVFYIGFAFVLIRACIQLYLSFSSIPGQLNGQAVQPIVKSFANMLALMLPTWAAYFTSKLVLCNFEGLYGNDTAMLEELNTVRQMINDEKQKESLAYSDLYYLSKDVTSVILGEITEWYSQINTKTVTKL